MNVTPFNDFNLLLIQFVSRIESVGTAFAVSMSFIKKIQNRQRNMVYTLRHPSKLVGHLKMFT